MPFSRLQIPRFQSTVSCWKPMSGPFVLSFPKTVILQILLKKHTVSRLHSKCGRRHWRWLAFLQMLWRDSSKVRKWNVDTGLKMTSFHRKKSRFATDLERSFFYMKWLNDGHSIGGERLELTSYHLVPLSGTIIVVIIIRLVLMRVCSPNVFNTQWTVWELYGIQLKLGCNILHQQVVFS